MSIARGSNSVINFKAESSYGVAPTGNWNGLTFSSETLGGTINEIISDEIRPDRATAGVRGGNIATGGTIATDFSLTRLGVLLAHLMGEAYADTTITPAAGADTTAYERGDIITVGSNDYICISAGTSGVVATDLTSTVLGRVLTSGTAEFEYCRATATSKYRHLVRGSDSMFANGVAFEKGILGADAPLYVKLLGGRADSLQVTIPQEGIVKGSWNFLFSGQMTKSTSSSAGTPTTIGEDGATGYETSLEINGVKSAVMKEANFTISNAFDADTFVVGSRYRVDISPKTRAINGSVTAFFATSDEYDKFLNEEKFGLKFSFVHRGDYLSFEFPECKFFGDPTPKISNNGSVTIQFNFRAFKQDEDYDVELVLKNTIASYTV